MSFSEFRRSEEFQNLQNTVPAGSFNISPQVQAEALNNRIENQTGIGPGQATQGGVTTQEALDLADSFREDSTDNTNKNKEKHQAYQLDANFF